jgi:sec-independent protein translocase protein TatB
VFDIAFSELILIGIVALVVIGPKRLPEVARAAGRWMARARHFVENVKRDMDVELRKDELAELRKVKEQLSETRQLFEQTAHSTLAALPAIQPIGAADASPHDGAKVIAPSGSGTRTAKTKQSTARRKAVKKKNTANKRGQHGRSTRKPR